ncbi:MAG: cold shock domain-containing protein [Candidatus Oceanisphaera merdipullorum]|nr:cold shock domain-containing protein [Candidatus Oceanisphaera merdipullorum]
MEGKICQWKNKQSVGFIQPNDGSERLFFDLSRIKDRNQRPQVGKPVSYETVRDEQERLKAINVQVAECLLAPNIIPSRLINTEPPRSKTLSYVFILTALLSLSAVGYHYYLTQDIAHSWYFGVPALVAALLLLCPKRPKEKQFTCRGCHAVAEYDARTLAAWKAGFTQLYCQQCHSKWLRLKPKSARQPEYNSSISRTTSNSGCLGIKVVLAFIPIVAGVALYQWLV